MWTNFYRNTKVFSILLVLLFCLQPFLCLADAPTTTANNSQTYKDRLLNLINSTRTELISSQKDLMESKKLMASLQEQLTTARGQLSTAKEQSSQASELVEKLNQQIVAQEIILQKQSDLSTSLQERLTELNKELNHEKNSNTINRILFPAVAFGLGFIISWMYFHSHEMRD
jgi:septal ring factor EnvC (AmiA/AmiB activator)